MEDEIRKFLEATFETLKCYFSDCPELIFEWMEDNLKSAFNHWYITQEEFEKAKQDLEKWRWE